MIDENDKNTVNLDFNDSHKKNPAPRGRPTKNGKCPMTAAERKRASRKAIKKRVDKAVVSRNYSNLTEADCLYIISHNIFGKANQESNKGGRILGNALKRLVELRKAHLVTVTIDPR